MKSNRFQLGYIALMLMAVLLSIAIGWWTWPFLMTGSDTGRAPALTNPAPVSPVRAPSREEARRRARQLVNDELDRALLDARQAVNTHLSAIEDFFVTARRNTSRFAEQALGLSSKIALIVDHLPFTSGGKHAAYLKRAFEECLFSPRDIEELARRVVRDYLGTLASIESQALVKIRADIADLPFPISLVAIDVERGCSAVERALAGATRHVETSLETDAAASVVSMIAGEALAGAALRIGASAGFLSAGAVSGPMTFGVGLAAGLLVDQLVSAAWDALADPRGELARELELGLAKLEREVVEGSPGAPGLRPRLEQLTQDRFEALRQMILAPNATDTGEGAK
jgi:hypothetical protein